MPPLLADFIHAGACIPICEKFLTLPPRFLYKENHSLGEWFSLYKNPRKPMVSGDFECFRRKISAC